MAKKATKNKAVKENTLNRPHRSRWQWMRTGVVLVTVGILLTIAQTGWWISHTIYDTDTFAQITTTALTKESSREAIANEIVSQSFASKPVLQATLGKSATKLIASLLATDQASTAITKVSEKAQTVLTSEKPDPITFNLVPLKKGLVVISAIAERVDKPIEVDAAEIPDSITLLNRNEIPDLYKVNQTVLFLTPLCIFLSIALLGYLLYSGREKIYKVLLQIGIMLSVVSLIGLMSGPLVRPPVLSLVGKANARIILGNLYDGFIAPFNTQMTNMGIAGVILIVFAGIQLGVVGATIRKVRHSK
ncbi:MAG: hypothetical protein QG628_554 [Patescibacteria group bacterium]|jgi:hypothetical protein|nr:hypothetical protein [Patescibacteria group bacterium]